MNKIEERVSTLATRLKDLVDQTRIDGIKFTRSACQPISKKTASEVARYEEIARRAGQLLHTKMTPEEARFSKLLLGKIAEGFLKDPREIKELSKIIADTPNQLDFYRNKRFNRTIDLGYIHSRHYGLNVDPEGWKDSTGISHPLSFSIFTETLSKDPWELVFNSRDHFNNAEVTRAENTILERFKALRNQII